MSLARRAMNFRVRGRFGTRFVAVAAGHFSVDDVDGFLVRIAQVDRETGTLTQVLNASRVAGVDHLVHATRLALEAQANGTGFASSVPIELICWASAERQIGRAFEKMGLREGKWGLAVLTTGTSSPQTASAVKRIFGELGGEWDNGLLELNQEKIAGLQKMFSINNEELAVAPVERIILERVALLALAKQ